MFTRILVPTDFSPPSDAAMEYAKRLATTFGSSINFLHVIDDPGAASAFIADGYAPATADLRELALTEARVRLEQLLSAADRRRFRVTTDAIIGVPADTIVDYALATDAAIIVMGTHGRSGLAHLLMGSVAEHVVRTASCPVLTVRQAIAPVSIAVRASDFVPVACAS